MARDCLALLADPGRRKGMGAVARERAITTFEEGPVIDQYEAVYRRVLG